MKKYSFIIGLFLLFFSLSCSKSADEASYSFVAEKTEVKVGEKVNFTIKGNCEAFSIYTGDKGHEYLKSYAVVTNGLAIDDESLILEKDALAAIETNIRDAIAKHNIDFVSPKVEIDADLAMSRLYSEVADKTWSSGQATKYALYLILPYMNDLHDVIYAEFTDYSSYLAPEDGFSEGVVLSSADRFDYTYSHSYSATGVYEAVVIGTNLGNKDYSSGGSYNLARTIKKVIITVTE